MRRLLASEPSPEPDSADALWSQVLEVGLAHQRAQAKERARRRAATLKHIRRLQDKIARTQNEAARSRSLHALRRQQAKLQHQNHRDRRERDAQADHEAQMAATGQGKAAKPWLPHQPITRVEEPSTCTVQAATAVTSGSRVQLRLTTAVTPGQVHTDQQAIEASVAAFWKNLLNSVHSPTEQAERDKAGVLARLQSATAGLLSQEVREGLQTANLIDPENIAVAIRSLSRGSTPGEDDMTLDFFLEHIDLVAPLLSKLFARILATGKMTPKMCRAVLSPLYKNKGSPHDRAMYRPVSVTTIPYRILAKCIAQKLNAAIPLLVGDPQTGYVVGRSYDENVRVVRQTAHDINHHRPQDGGIMLMLDNAKAFDRLQHEFALDVLRAFNLPPSLINAVQTLYKDAETRVKINGHLTSPFPNTSGVKQGCPLSGLLYILVQEVQLRMIREDTTIRGIPIPGPDGELTPAPAATRLAPPPHALKERGLVDDTMIALATSESVPPLLRVLDRFEAMSNHRMNISKTMMLLLGSERGFDLRADSPAARALRQRGLQRTYDITPGRDDTLPEKWHGIVLGNEDGVTAAWEGAAAQAGAAADSLHASPIPHGSQGRVNLAQHKLMSKVFATLRLTAPADQGRVGATLRALQKHANGLVFGKRWWLTEKAATQPRSALGIGHLHVTNYMQTAWAQPLLDAMGRTTEDRPYKHYFAHYARQAYPGLGMGREMLSLNLSFSRIVGGPPEAMPGEARQAFKAVAALPPLRYAAPDPDTEPACQPREDLPREGLLAQPLLHNPILDAHPAQSRATPAEEQEMLRWASHGVTRVRHVLHDTGRRVLTFQELAARHPGLVGTARERDRVRRMHGAIRENLDKWKKVIAAPPCAHVQAGQFRHDAEGRLLRATETGTPARPTVRARVCQLEAQSGLIRVTSEEATLPAAATGTDLQPAITLQCSDTESDDDEETDDRSVADRGEETRGRCLATPAAIAEAKARQFRHATVAPRGAPPTPDPRLLEWPTPKTNTPPGTVNLAYSTTKQVRQTYLAHEWAEPRSLRERYADALADLTPQQRSRLLTDLAAAATHWAIPEEERRHFLITVHHGHLQGGNKCKGDHRWCARCLKAGHKHEDTATHTAHSCPAAREVWTRVAKAWEDATGEHLDISSARLTVLGLRPEPQQAATPPEKARHKATEPAWRLLHAVTLLQIYKARTRVHMAHHADHGPHDAKRATPKHILRAVKQRVAARVQYEHDRALHASREQPKPSTHKSAWAKFHSHWIATGIASIRKGGPRLNLLSPPPPAQPLPAKAVHIRVTATLHPAKGKQPPKAAWAIAVEDLDEAGRATARMEATAAIATEATHGPNHPACQATRHTWQVAHQVAVAKGLRSAAQHRRRGRPIVLTVHNVTAVRDLQPHRAGARRRTSHGQLARNNLSKLQELNAQPGLTVTVRADAGPQPARLQRLADQAARSGALRSRHPADCASHANAPWDELRVWDPGD